MPQASDWPPTRLFNYNSAITRNISTDTLHAIQIGATWSQRVIPALVLTPTSLLLATGTQLLRHPLEASHKWAGRVALPPEIHPIAPGKDSTSDIVGLHALDNGNVIAAHYDGTVQRLDLAYRRSTAHYMHPKREMIHVLAGHHDRFLTGSDGRLRLYNATSPWIPPTDLKLGEGRPWSALLLQNSAYIGISGGIRVARIRDSEMVVDTTLHGMMPGHSAVYGIVAKDNGTLLSAWYDGMARLHDLRAGDSPVMQMDDPWSDSALYSVAWVGSHGVAAGGAQHGTVSVWDVRNPRGGWSVFSPGGRGSPVYQLAGDGGRVWGVTRQRAFVLAFDGSGDVPEGICRTGARVKVGQHKDVPKGYGRRGRKLSWTVYYGEHAAKEVSMGYAHRGRGMSLFETQVAV